MSMEATRLYSFNFFFSVTHYKMADERMNQLGSILQPPTLLRLIDIWQTILVEKILQF
jgi:hypothetical protein